MDAVKCIKELNRMCKTHNRCSGCPLEGRCYLLWETSAVSESIEALVATIEKWSKEHPIVTNGMKFKEYVPYDKISMSTDSPFVTIRVSRNWWDAEYKEGDE